MLRKSKRFLWQGIDDQGFKIGGECVASNSKAVSADLHQKNILPLTIRRKRQSLQLRPVKKIKPMHITQFSRELATLIAAGIPLAMCLGIIAENTAHKPLQQLFLDLQKNIHNGRLLSDALKSYPEYFDPIMSNLVSIGEQSGLLELLLLQIAEHREKMANLKQKIKKAFYYPCIVLITAMFVTLGLLIWVIPEFSQLFASMGAELPSFTRSIIAITYYLDRYGGYGLLSLIIIGIAIKVSHSRFLYMQYLLAYSLLNIPIFGSIYQASIFARCFNTLAITLQAGLPLLNALELTAKISGNPIYENIWHNIANKICQGASLQKTLLVYTQFPARVKQMIAIGEESGQLEALLGKLSEYYAATVDHFVSHLNQFLEPAIMIFLAVVIGGLVIAVYLPIFQLGSVIG